MAHSWSWDNQIVLKKTFLTQKFEKEYYIIYSFQILKTFPDSVYLLRTMEAWICRIYVKYAWKPMCKISSKSTIKAQKWCEWHCFGVFILSFRGVCIENPVKHLQYGSFFVKYHKMQVSSDPRVTLDFLTFFNSLNCLVFVVHLNSFFLYAIWKRLGPMFSCSFLDPCLLGLLTFNLF